MKAISHILLSLAIIFCTSYLKAIAGEEGKAKKESDDTFVHLWSPENEYGEGPDLKVVVRKFYPNTLKVLDGEKAIYAFDLQCYPDSVLSLSDGNLGVLGITGAGYCSLFAFHFSNGKISNVLVTPGCKLPPEFVYQTKGTIMGCVHKDQTGKFTSRGIPFFTHRIIAPNAEWAGEELVPVSANIYSWNYDKNKYDVRKNVPWKRRLSGL